MYLKDMRVRRRRSSPSLRSALGALVLLALGASSPGPAAAFLKGTKHDFRGSGASSGSDKICDYCHTTHKAVQKLPRWNRLTAATYYKTYSSTKIRVPVHQPDGTSKLCLSCHDGTLGGSGFFMFSGRRGAGKGAGLNMAGRLPPGSPANLGTDISDDHPVSIFYNATFGAEGAELKRSGSASGLGGSIRTDLLDANGKMQCSSCHDPHRDRNGMFLKKANERGELFMTCHNVEGYELGTHSAAGSFKMSKNCMECHVPHAARGKFILREPEERLCALCHPLITNSMANASTPTHHHVISAERKPGVKPLKCASCHEPHIIQGGALGRRNFLVDPVNMSTRSRLLPGRQTPYNYKKNPRKALRSGNKFCLDCHDGSWFGAKNIRAELSRAGTINTGFYITSGSTQRNGHYLHTTLSSSSLDRNTIGCTYCHDVHASGGTGGIKRKALLYDWLTVNEYPYTAKRSCSSSDLEGACHR